MGFSKWLAVALAVGVVSVSEAQSRPCPRPAPRQIAQGATVVITAAPRPPCRLEIVDTPIELRADARGDVGGIERVYRGPDGKFYTKYKTEISVWSAEGRFLRNFGQQGSGPGEFGGAVGWPHLHFDRENRLYFLDQVRWSVFSPTFELLRTALAVAPPNSRVAVPGSYYDTDVAMLLDDGTFLGADPSYQRSGFYFHLWDIGLVAGRTPSPPSRTGTQSVGAIPLVQMFDSVPAAERDVAVGRAIGYGGGDTFWAGPPWGTTTRGYEIELWRTDGSKLRTLKRDVPWIPISPQRPPPARGEGVPQAKPVPMIGGIMVDSSGLLYVVGSRANDTWRPQTRRLPGDQTPFPNRDAMVDWFADVIDPNAGVVLASIGPMTRPQRVRELPLGMFRGTRLGHRLGESSEGYSTVRIVEYRLVAQ